MDSSSSLTKAAAMTTTRVLKVGDRCELRIYSGSRAARLEIFDVTIIEMFTSVARVQLWNGNVLRVMTSQLKAF